MNCTCDSCKRACQHKPGWFLPGEAEKVAEYLEITLQKLFETRLAVDWHVSSSIFVLSPVTVRNLPGIEFPYDPRGQCIFYNLDGTCEIYPVRPRVCQEYSHDDSRIEIEQRHPQVAEAWREQQQIIIDLLGREPEQAENDFSINLFDVPWPKSWFKDLQAQYIDNHQN